MLARLPGNLPHTSGAPTYNSSAADSPGMHERLPSHQSSWRVFVCMAPVSQLFLHLYAKVIRPAEQFGCQIGCQTQKLGSIDEDGARQTRIISGEPPETRTLNPLMKSYPGVRLLCSGPNIPRLGCSSASSRDKSGSYFIKPPAPIVEVIPANWQECDEKPRNSREYALIQQDAPT